MKTETLLFDWKIEFPEGLSLLTNEEGLVVLLSPTQTYGDIQPLVLELTDSEVRCITKPYFLQELEISVDKVITVTASGFFHSVQGNIDGVAGAE